MAPTIRPKSLQWENGEAFDIAQSALGEFSVLKQPDNFWYAKLNEGSFPVIYETEEEARKICEIAACLEGHPKNIDLVWTKNEVGGSSTATIADVYHTVKSKTISGFYLMGKNGPVSIPMGTKEEAKDACSQYIMCVWYELTEVVQ